VAGAAVVVLLAVPAPVAAISLIGLLNRPGWPGAVYDSAAIVVLGYFVRFLPVAVLLLVPGVRRVPRDAERAARVDGCDWSREHWHVRLPALLPDVALAWLVLVIFSFAELGATLLLAPPGVTVAAVRAFTLLHFGVYRDVAVLAVLSVGLIVVPWALLMLLLWRGHWRRLREGA
ncbi:MAG TPA: ABC transporter permease subunit, partial [Phycisphaerae bacterium]|nr:ABC transporter permease subunit [Phycisphaerae bacterium]